MNTTRQGRLDNFVPLYNLVRAVADCIAISDEEADAPWQVRTKPRFSEFEAQLVRLQTKAIMAQSRAADVLFDVLNEPPSRRPHWCDVSLGRAELDDSVGRSGMKFLNALARSALALGREVKHAEAPDLERLSNVDGGNIGFRLSELIPYLDLMQVAHTLSDTGVASVSGSYRDWKTIDELAAGPPPKSASEGPEGSESLSVWLSRTLPIPEPVAEPEAEAEPEPEPEPEAEAEAEAELGTHTTEGVRAIRRKRRFRGVLAEVLQTALDNARDPEDYKSVFAALYELASQISQIKPYWPLTGVSQVDYAVLWIDDDLDKPKFFTEEHMKSRMRTRKDT